MEETKMTVEQVKAAANEQISILYQKLQEANMNNTFRRLDYLFKIVEGDFNKEMRERAENEINNIVLGPSNEDSKKE